MKLNIINVFLLGTALYASSTEAWWSGNNEGSEYAQTVQKTYETIEGLSSQMKEYMEQFGNKINKMNKQMWNKLSDFNVMEKEDEYFLYMDLPGYKVSDINVRTNKNMIILSANHTCEKSKLPSIINDLHDMIYKPEYTCIERETRTKASLPNDAVMDKMQTLYEDGVLKIRIPIHNEDNRLHQLQEHWNEFTEIVANKVQDAANSVAQGFNSAVDNLKDTMDDVKRNVENNVEQNMDTVKTNLHHVSEDAKDKIHKIVQHGGGSKDGVENMEDVEDVEDEIGSGCSHMSETDEKMKSGAENWYNFLLSDKSAVKKEHNQEEHDTYVEDFPVIYLPAAPLNPLENLA